MKSGLPYMVCCQLTLAEVQCGQIVGTRQVKRLVSSQTAELHEILTDLYEQFRSPYLLGLQITSIRFQRSSTTETHDYVVVENQPSYYH